MKQIIELISASFEVAGVIVLVVGTLSAFTAYVSSLLRQGSTPTAYHALRQAVGKAILMGLELLVAADIIRTVAIDPTFLTVGVLGLIVLVRTFLSWSLELEIHGKWPWQRPSAREAASPDAGER